MQHFVIFNFLDALEIHAELKEDSSQSPSRLQLAQEDVLIKVG